MATEHPTTTHPKYRPDIDGLRAVAVLAVVIFHAFPEWLPGGFVGVDVFFVISGFLISSILYRSFDQGAFSFADFYARRIKRIFPALLLVLVACLVIGWAILLTDEYAALGESVLGGTSFLANVQLWTQAGYFDTKAELKPLLHLWSLGVEEQFYIIWPLLLWLTYRTRISPFAVAVLLLAGSFALNIDAVQVDRTRTFYLPDTRFWELLAGSLLAYAIHRAKPLHVPRLAREGTAAAGAALLVAAIALIRADDYFPGWWAVLPIAGAVLLIAAGPATWINARLLGNRAMREIGLLSFALYLWHWPLLVFARLVSGGTPTEAVRAGIVAASIALAWLTVRLERPIRFGTHGRMKVAGLCASMLLLAGTGYLISQQQLVPHSNSAGLERIMAAAGEWEYPGKAMRSVTFADRTIYVRDGQQESTVFIGDSNVEQYAPRIEQLIAQHADKANTAAFVTASGCPPIPGVTEKDHPGCEPSLRAALAYAKQPNVSTVVISALWDAYFLWPGSYELNGLKLNDQPARAPTFAALAAMIRELTTSGKRVYLVLTIPNGPNVDPKSMVRRTLYPIGFYVDTFGLPVHDYLHGWYNQTGKLRAQLRAAAETAGATVIDPMAYLCTATTCPSITASGEPIYKDAAHLRPSYVRESVQYLDHTILPGTHQAVGTPPTQLPEALKAS